MTEITKAHYQALNKFIPSMATNQNLSDWSKMNSADGDKFLRSLLRSKGFPIADELVDALLQAFDYEWDTIQHDSQRFAEDTPSLDAPWWAYR